MTTIRNKIVRMFAPPDHPTDLAPSEHYAFYREHRPSPAEMSLRQLWRSLSPEVNTPYIICERLPPYKMAFDFSTFDSSDEAHIEIHAELHGPNRSQVRWELLEEHDVGITGVSGTPYLTVNKSPTQRGKILIIEPLNGPWVTRIMYTQTLGFNRPVRLMLLL